MGTCSSKKEGFKAATELVHEMFFPMYVVKVQDFLAMGGPPKAHDVPGIYGVSWCSFRGV